MANTKYTYNEKRKEWYTLVWDGTYDAKGKKHRKFISSKKSSRDLEEKVNAMKAAVNSRSAVEYSSMSFYDYAVDWVNISKATKEEYTKKQYLGTVKYFSSLDNVKIGEIRHSHFQRIINENAEHPRTCQLISMTFRQIVKAAARDHLLSRLDVDDLLQDVSMPHYERTERRPLSTIEKDALMKADFDMRNEAFVFILYYLGLRKSEALALMPEDFDWENKVVRIRRAVIFVSGKGTVRDYPKSHNGIRSVPMPDAMIPHVRDFVEASEGLIFRNRSGDPMSFSGYDRMWDSIITTLNIADGYKPNAKKDRRPRRITDLTAHIFRHNYCTELCYMVPKGHITTKKIAQIFGDTEEMVLKIYSHIIEEKEDASGAVNAAFQN